jgi:hypothetical protein
MTPEELKGRRKNVLYNRTFRGIPSADTVKLNMLINPVAEKISQGASQEEIVSSLVKKARLSHVGAENFYSAVKKVVDEENKA